MTAIIDKNLEFSKIYDCAKVFWNQCLLDDNSLIFNKKVWTLENLEILRHRVALTQDGSKDKFLTRLRRQIEKEAPSITRLAGEILVVYHLFPSPHTISSAAKRDRVNTVFAWNGDLLSQEHYVFSILEYGIAGAKVAYSAYIDLEVAFLIDVAIAFKETPTVKRNNLHDPWKFQNLLDSIHNAHKRQGRDMLLHMIDVS